MISHKTETISVEEPSRDRQGAEIAHDFFDMFFNGSGALACLARASLLPGDGLNDNRIGGQLPGRSALRVRSRVPESSQC